MHMTQHHGNHYQAHTCSHKVLAKLHTGTHLSMMSSYDYPNMWVTSNTRYHPRAMCYMKDMLFVVAHVPVSLPNFHKRTSSSGSFVHLQVTAIQPQVT